MFERVLLATYGSSHAKEALKYASDLARRDHAQVILVHAFALVPSYMGEQWADRAMARHVTAGHQVANEAAQKLQEAGQEVIVEVLEDPPADAILRVADARQCDLIAMGSRGHGTPASLLLGIVSDRVLAHAEAPVMIVSAIAKEAG